jgi:hypothetical protein
MTQMAAFTVLRQAAICGRGETAEVLVFAATGA